MQSRPDLSNELSGGAVQGWELRVVGEETPVLRETKAFMSGAMAVGGMDGPFYGEDGAEGGAEMAIFANEMPFSGSATAVCRAEMAFSALETAFSGADKAFSGSARPVWGAVLKTGAEKGLSGA